MLRIIIAPLNVYFTHTQDQSATVPGCASTVEAQLLAGPAFVGADSSFHVQLLVPLVVAECTASPKGK